MTLNIDIITKKGTITDLSEEISFNYIRNAYDFHNAMIYNAGIDIRTFPFFPYDEYQKEIYPDSQRKSTMLYLTKQMKDRFHNKSEMVLHIPLSRWRMDQDFKPSLKGVIKKIVSPSTLFGDKTVIITLYQNAQSEKLYYVCKDYYDKWVDSFLLLINNLMKEDNGFYVTD